MNATIIAQTDYRKNQINALLNQCRIDSSIKSTMALVTPSVAEQMLRRNSRNRKISEGTIEKYSRDLLAGVWMPSSAGIGFDTDGVLLDGQHRLKMILKTNTSAWLLVVTGLPPESQVTIDRQRKRTMYDVLFLSGDTNSRESVQIATFLARTGSAQRGNYPSDGEIRASLSNHRDAINEVLSIFGQKRKKGIARAAVMASIVLGMEKNKSATSSFLTMLINGGVPNDEPAGRLRKYLVEEGPRYGHGGELQDDDFRRTNFALNAHFKGQKINRLLKLESLE